MDPCEKVAFVYERSLKLKSKQNQKKGALTNLFKDPLVAVLMNQNYDIPFKEEYKEIMKCKIEDKGRGLMLKKQCKEDLEEKGKQ